MISKHLREKTLQEGHRARSHARPEEDARYCCVLALEPAQGTVQCCREHNERHPSDAVEEVRLDHGNLTMGTEVGPKRGYGVGGPWGGCCQADGKAYEPGNDVRKSGTGNPASSFYHSTWTYVSMYTTIVDCHLLYSFPM